MSHQESHGSVKSYVIGFILSIILTIIPLVLTLKHVISGTTLIVSIVAMAVLQLLVQLFFFMHIREKDGDKPRYNVWALILGLFIVFVIVAGSMWIMTFNAQVA
ncbi:cytochrome o ubiquinol oxidase subunit IV [Falsibacillus pallidus]|uniref:Cytochrome o ubiquinol oxidase operon protein cyoD n=1 Tax=Falsibacillus pallidus TaxID=493781 RepID=A0A370G5L0_9BACI|nr:cytochrome o ubiquinol oxidase subunit IV [Falsibacillus pallidus]RDI39111.1 cytochrome o ubiquinol oxidase operon protein cyoD [Falsibacillus pallidus]